MNAAVKRDQDLQRDETSRAIRAMDCRGCPYSGCLGATDTLSWPEMVARLHGVIDAEIEARR